MNSAAKRSKINKEDEGCWMLGEVYWMLGVKWELLALDYG